jgi:phosphoglycolate phosphatase
MKLSKKYKYYLFDLDGTITDPGLGITNSVKYALIKMGIDAIDRAILLKFIGPPLRDSFKKYFGMDDLQAEKTVQYYREYYSPTGIFENEVYEGIAGLLEKLTENNNTLFIVTSKPRVFAERIIQYFGLQSYFKDIIGSELNGELSEKTELIEHFLNKYDVITESVIMIGDRNYDIIGASNNRIDSIGVGYGYGTKEELLSAGATYYCQSVAELYELIGK